MSPAASALSKKFYREEIVMKKKFLAAFLAMTMVFGLAACGGGDNAGSGNDGNQGSAEGGNESTGADNTGDDSGEVWTCTIPWPSIDESGDPAGLADVEAAINEITVPEIGVQVEIAPIYCYNLNQQQTLDVSSGGDLDLILCMLETNASYIKNEAIIPITDLYNEYGATIQESLGEAVNACAVNGELYTIPVASLLGQSYGFVMRSDLLEKYGYSTETQTMTPEELTELFAKVKEGEGAAFYPVAGLVDAANFVKYDDLGVSLRTGGLLLDGDTDTVVNVFASEKFAAYADLVYQWAQAGYMNPDASNEDSPATQVAAGNYGGQFSSTQPGQDVWVGNTAGYDMTIINVAGVDNPFSITTMTSNISWGISSNCDNPEKAMQLLNLMFGDNDFGTIMTAGLEGQTYEVVESDADGNMIIDFPEGLDMMSVPYYNLFGVWPHNKTQWAPNELSYFEELPKYNARMEYSPAYGYTFDTTGYETQLTALDAVFAQYQATIYGGKQDPATVLPEFLKALEDAGINDVIAANQEQYNTWKAATGN